MRKLRINRETLRLLDQAAMRKVAGGAPTTNCSEARYTCTLVTLPVNQCVVATGV